VNPQSTGVNKWPGVLLAIATGLFVAWSAWLGYHAATLQTIVVSGPQIRRAPLLVEAKLNSLETTTIIDVNRLVKGEALEQLELRGLEKVQGWQGPGVYLLPLQPVPSGQGVYRVAPIPNSPGYFDEAGTSATIYPANDSTREQVRRIFSPH
jgi:hypothetical protein